MNLDWPAFFIVAGVALVGACAVVVLYATGLRLLATSGRIPHAAPAEFTDAITIVTPAEAAAEAKRIRKAEKRNPLTNAQKRFALVGAYACFIVCGGVVLFGIYLIVPALHQ